ncbi:MAG: diaminopimelate decarboxylase [Candidatus Marinimicrobia bacterium]|nr:diaminopimelate decarboxylase [Candidatus Neomarinimicrobiota bacterium]MCF7850971.1 diaminopimelate decarboxylase [Candidatus Neomarinimicrobiota bacterium]
MSFIYRDGLLHCDDVDLKAIAKAHGTPVYIYSESILRRNAEVLKTSFIDRGFKVSYAMKANANPAILKIFRSYGLGVDIVSGGELKMAQYAGYEGSEINYAGVGKTSDELDLALDTGIAYFNVESLFELEVLNEHAINSGSKAKVLLRLNPDIDPQTHPHISTGLRENKFGMAAEQVTDILTKHQNYAGVSFEGIHCHIGSQILRSQPFDELIDYLVTYTAELEKRGVEIKHIDFGGGFGVNYEDPFEDILQTTPYLNDFAEKAARDLSKYQLHIQPGRVLVANTSVLLTAVLGVKENHGHQFTVIDAASTEIIRPALYDAYHAVYPYQENMGVHMSDVVGPVCESSDFLAKGRQLPKAVAGDLLVIGSAGAYASSMSSTYNLRPLCPEVLVKSDGDVAVIKRRQTFDEMIDLFKL